jgi:6,7-dimethyl-8-ribityllumazine synthase
VRVAKKKVAAKPIDRALAARVRIGIIRAEFNSEITTSLETWCLDSLRESGVPDKNIARFTVPGCFEIPVVAKKLAGQSRFDVLIALGVVIRGETHHFELIANECARGVMQVSIDFGIPVIFEVLAVYKRGDAMRRASANTSNKGVEAAQAALSVFAMLEELDAP